MTQAQKADGCLHQRDCARLAVIQSLYAAVISDAAAQETQNRMVREGGAWLSDEQRLRMDVAFFRRLAAYVHEQPADTILEAHLQPQRTLARLDVLLGCMLRVAAAEIVNDSGVDRALQIHAYLQISALFFNAAETKFVNGVLDALARSAHADPMPEA